MVYRTDEEYRLIRLFALCNSFKLTRGERIETACIVLNREIKSFKDLSPDEVERMIDALNGAVYIAKIKLEKKRGARV